MREDLTRANLVLGPVTLDESQTAALSAACAGGNLYIQGGPGTGKTTLALATMRDAIDGQALRGASSWAGGMLLTADRRRAAALEARLMPLVNGMEMRLRADGSHRLVRSLNSYAYMILGLWLVERDEPLRRPHLLSGAEEDAWLVSFLAETRSVQAPGLPASIPAGEAVRMEVRNVMARAGQAGLLPDDLEALAREFQTPVWQLAARAYREFAGGKRAFGVDTAHFDSARLPRIAANVLRGWSRLASQEAVQAPPPLPARLIVDDAQDLPLSALPLLQQAAQMGAQLVITGNADEATAQFRGGVPSLGEQVIAAVGGETLDLQRRNRGSSRVQAATAQVESWLRQARPVRREDSRSRLPLLAPISHQTYPSPAHSVAKGADVLAHRVATRSQMAETVSAILRERHLHGRVEWQNMAVIVRHASALEGLQRSLSRNGVPIQSGERPVVLSRIPIVRTLLTLLAASEGQSVEEENRDALELVVSPLVGADSLEVFRLLRDYRARSDAPAGMGIADLLEAVAAGTYQPPGSSGSGSRLERATQCLARAAQVWVRRRKARAMDPRVGLWSLWDGAQIATELRAQSQEHSAAGRIADEQLDAVMALFRRADLWSQEEATSGRGAGDAAEFAREVLAQTVATDPLVPQGLAEAGVWVITPAQAAGREWESVVVADLEEGTWPSRSPAGRADTVLEAALEDARARGWKGERTIGDFLPDRDALFTQDSAAMRGQRRRDEARLFLVAISRSRGQVDLVAVENEGTAASSFFTALVEGGFAHLVEGGLLAGRYLTMTALVSGLRQRLTAVGSTPDQRREAALLLALLTETGVRSADPDLWGARGAISTDSPVLAQGPVRVGPASIQTGRDCPLRWFLSDVGGRRQDLHDEAQALDGATIGELLHTLAEENPDAGPERMRERFRELWERAQLPRQTYWERRAFDEASEMAAKMGAYFASVDGEVLTEQAIAFEAGDVMVSGRVDRIEIDDTGAARIVDIKSGKGDVGAKAEENAQLTAYQIGVSELGYQSAGAALLVLRERTALRTQAPLAGEELVAARDAIADLAPSLGAARIAATPKTGGCQTCPFRHVCPAHPDSVRSSE